MSLLQKTAEAIYLTATADDDNSPSYERLDDRLHKLYEQMAIAALTIAYREPVEEPGSCLN